MTVLFETPPDHRNLAKPIFPLELLRSSQRQHITKTKKRRFEKYQKGIKQSDPKMMEQSSDIVKNVDQTCQTPLQIHPKINQYNYTNMVQKRSLKRSPAG